MTHSGSPAILSPSPSLSIYSSSHLTDIAARVIQQLRLEDDGHDDVDTDNPFSVLRANDDFRYENTKEEEEEEEFTFVCQPQYSSPTPADQIFSDGRIRPVYSYPHFVVNHEESDLWKQKPKKLRLPLGQFLMEERESSSTSWCSSSEEGAEEEYVAQELEGVEPGSYCVWRPEAVKAKEQGMCRKSRSSSSRRWRFGNYFVLKRSRSDGTKDSFVILRRSKKGGGGQN